MAKFDNSYYAKIWQSKEGGRIVSDILKNSDLVKIRNSYYADRFRIDNQVCPTDAKGEATFVSRMRDIERGSLMDMRAPLSDTTPADKKGLEYYSDTIPEFSARGFKETASERLYKEDLFDQFGDAALIAAYATDEIQRMIDSAQQTMSYQGAMLISTGRILYDQGVGIQGSVIKAKIPTENFINAGEKIWSASDCEILSQMITIQDKFKNKWGLDLNMTWEIEKKQFDEVFVKNAQVIEWVRYINTINNNTSLPDTFTPTTEMVAKALSKYPGLDPIVICDEQSYDYVNGLVKGWKSGIAVYRPAGYVGYIRKASLLDEKVFGRYSNKVNTYNFTKVLNGIATIMNSEIANGNFKEWHTDLIMKAIPTLDEFLYHVVVDTTTANE
ncbi:MAG: hypothetical protein ACI35S_06775 [Anaeroplasma sp.]